MEYRVLKKYTSNVGKKKITTLPAFGHDKSAASSQIQLAKTLLTLSQKITAIFIFVYMMRH